MFFIFSIFFFDFFVFPGEKGNAGLVYITLIDSLNRTHGNKHLRQLVIIKRELKGFGKLNG